jgi:PH domain
MLKEIEETKMKNSGIFWVYKFTKLRRNKKVHMKMLGGFPPGKSGWLLKRGHFIRNMKKRWVKLVEGQIKYYVDNSCKAEKGSIKLKGDFLLN